jgi:hypothetical protein
MIRRPGLSKLGVYCYLQFFKFMLKKNSIKQILNLKKVLFINKSPKIRFFLPTIFSNFLIKIKTMWNYFYFIYAKKYIFSIFSFKNYFKIIFPHFYIEEMELRGLNYRFSKLRNYILWDLGVSHFQFFSFPQKKFLFLSKKWKIKKFLFLSFWKISFLSSIKFLWYRLKSIGPYKLKGFQFVNEWIKLKEGKKPFK